MRELPILYSTPMVQAILENKKKMTRRTSGLEKVNEDPNKWKLFNHNSHYFHFESLNSSEEIILNCRCQIGDHLWVKETYRIPNLYGSPNYKYKADSDSNITGVKFKWKPSLFMPKVAARIWLEVTNVRCERLQDITEADAIAEGVRAFKSALFNDTRYEDYMDSKDSWRSPFSSFQSLWAKINGIDAWDLNPWVFVYEFKRIEKP